MSQSPPASGQSPNDENVSIHVYRSDLRAIHQSGLRLSSCFGSRKALRLRKRVMVESVARNVSETVLYARPHASNTHGVALVPTEHIMVPLSQNDPHLVRRNQDFEISFIGFSAAPKDLTAWNPNEIFMYSLSPAAQPKETSTTETEPPSSASISTGFTPSSKDAVRIHYDPIVDGRNEGTPPNLYTPIPASKSMYMRYSREKTAYDVNVRFTVMEIDNVTDLQARAIAGIDRVGMYVSNAAAAVPYADLLPRVFALASAAGRSGLKKYSRPDHVVSRDIKFLLSPAEGEEGEYDEGVARGVGQERCYPSHGDYLRYGYYFFLSESCEAKLYAQTGSSSQQVPLFMKRKDDISENERSYFPLTDISYVVMKVSPGCSEKWGPSSSEQVNDCDRIRLENILNMSSAIEALSTMKGRRRFGGRRPR
eukprot:GFKZ01007013.1.p1 GENE.GFKZ01007013.1~~GFKZ01007013.1.p1  ORF type:complete len:424 (+),score=52.10 GFKZ01007013.1:297-1568(+)